MKNITETQISPAVRTTRGKDTIGRLFFLEASGGRIPGAFRTVLAPRGSSKPEWLES